MNDLTGMFDQDLDTKIEAATYLLKQAADDAGVDLNDVDQESLSNMIADVVQESDEGGDDDDGDEGDGEVDGEGKTAGEITFADVAIELNKRAAYEGIDIADLDPQEYSAAFDKVASEMTDPEFSKFAAQADAMDQLGRIAARGFVDEINKIAAEEDDDDDDDQKVKKAAAKAKGIVAGIKKHYGNAASKARELGGKARDYEYDKSNRLGGSIRRAFGAKDSTNLKGSKAKAWIKKQDKLDTMTGRGAIGGGAAAVGGGGYAASRRDR